MPRRKKSDEPEVEIKKIKTPSLIKGMKDVLPSDHKYWRYLLDATYQLAKDFSFTWVDTPIIERAELYSHVFGRGSELIKKELVVFQDRSDKVALRLEYTPTIARSFVEHSLFNQTPPNKYWYSGKVFRQAKTSDYKHREMHEIGFEVYNEKSPSVDAELIVMMFQTFKDMGLNPVVRLNSLGFKPEYAKALTGFIKSRRSAVCAECRSNMVRDPLKFLQCVSNKCSKIIEEAPQSIDYLHETAHEQLFKLLETLDEVGVNYVLDSRLITDVAYYNGTIFSIVHKPEDPEIKDTSGQSQTGLGFDHVLAYGGRFNNLVEMLDGPETPAVGIRFQVEKVIAAIKENKLDLPKPRHPHVYLAQLSEQAKRAAMSFLQELRREDFRVVANFSKDSLKSQLDTAQKLATDVVLIMGQREVVDGTILLRDMDTGIQEVVNMKKVINEIHKKLSDRKKKR